MQVPEDFPQFYTNICQNSSSDAANRSTVLLQVHLKKLSHEAALTRQQLGRICNHPRMQVYGYRGSPEVELSAVLNTLALCRLAIFAAISPGS